MDPEWFEKRDRQIAARRQSIEEPLREIDAEEMKVIGTQLFPFVNDPWREAYYSFVETNPAARYYHAKTQDRIEVLYCRDREKGIWYSMGYAVGPLLGNALEMVKEVVARR